ncbi:sugar transferase [Pelagovum pacificum]|uniref:Sugar transferase n=1 Tax=Pelagovum pacificum TaxID=2588711 RepID=A0A5C5GHS4_9RHOB|nr:sugar transferase [Pelagovum pacificum]QQA42709.1 sugar transferase [Pelagovum pacificum]TNY34140.1 sugar transferase [Pelagovum pacificum]
MQNRADPIPFILYEARPAGSVYRRVGKRCLDLVLVALSAPLSVPLILLLAAIVRLDGGPGFYRHRRVGRNGREFACCKIRTMVPNADAVLRRHLEDPALAEEWARSRKLRVDPRITRIGYWLRRSSLDELPQLFNVLRGDMSLVGPRPVVHEELARYGAARGAYLSVVPGLTGLWQVSGRNDLSYRDRIALDRLYAERLSFALDLRLIFRTVHAVVSGSGR